MKSITKVVLVLTVLFSTLMISLASYAQVPPQWSCTSANARGFTWNGTAYGLGHAQRLAMSFCQNSGATAYAANCHIVGCQQVGYAAPAPVVAPPVYGQQFVCTAWGWHHRVSGTAAGYNLGKVQWKAIRNCTNNGGVNCQVYSSPSCPIS